MNRQHNKTKFLNLSTTQLGEYKSIKWIVQLVINSELQEYLVFYLPQFSNIGISSIGISQYFQV